MKQYLNFYYRLALATPVACFLAFDVASACIISNLNMTLLDDVDQISVNGPNVCGLTRLDIKLENTGLTFPGNQYSIEPVDAAKPVVVAEATPSSIQLTLTNLKLIALGSDPPFFNASISFQVDWAHEEITSQPLIVNLNGNFKANSDVDPSHTPTYSIDFAGSILDGTTELATLGIPTLTGPAVEKTDEVLLQNKSESISVSAGTHTVKGVVNFNFGYPATILLPDSASVSVPEPHSLPLIGVGFLILLFATRKRFSIPRAR